MISPVGRCWKLVSGVVVIASALISSGCGANRDQTFVPTEEVAQRALETALTAWQNGKRPPARVQEASPAIQFVDTHFQPGQKLAKFTILGATTGDADRCYAVRLTLDNPREEVRARFVVMGLDPLWVLRYEDFETVMHWEMGHQHSAPAQKPGS